MSFGYLPGRNTANSFSAKANMTARRQRSRLTDAVAACQIGQRCLMCSYTVDPVTVPVGSRCGEFRSCSFFFFHFRLDFFFFNK